ncbi:hypothetical protein [Cellulophaga sp. Hel_I_12]|uniref:hypothetical protein n=1 Tax=Cellulophaga sp. Hel_I_12 TaxID=1249972 RepID=UPI00064782CA|nr:hypothetical protein [Cellulophaga sp. Hel_I_12]
MKNYIFLYSILAVLVSCKDPVKVGDTSTEKTAITSALKKDKETTIANPYQDGESQKALFKALKKKTPLTNEQLLAALPQHIHGNQPIGEYALQAQFQEASGMYGSAQRSYTFWIEDGSGSKAIVRNFYDALKFKNQGPEGTEYVFAEHDGYQTIAFLQPNIKQNQISFIYNNRFKISLLGSAAADTLWSYIDFENLKKLNQYQ